MSKKARASARSKSRTPVISLAKLEPTAEVVAARDAVNAWPVLSVRGFLGQTVNDDELSAVADVQTDAKRVAIKLIGLFNAEDGEIAEAADVVLDHAGRHSSSVLQDICDRVFALGVLYGLRVGGGVR